jgi:hypothetical protein
MRVCLITIAAVLALIYFPMFVIGAAVSLCAAFLYIFVMRPANDGTP